MKGRDDFLTIYLANGGYIISLDKYKDFKNFKDIKPFNHFSVSDGSVYKKEKIVPSALFSSLEKPTIGNHFTYKILPCAELSSKHIFNGDIYVDKSGEFSVIYIYL